MSNLIQLSYDNITDKKAVYLPTGHAPTVCIDM